jgi:hypothetical protein
VIDVLVQNEGTVWLFNPLSERASQWVEEHVLTGRGSGWAGSLQSSTDTRPPLPAYPARDLLFLCGAFVTANPLLYTWSA